MIQPRESVLNFAEIMEMKLSQHDDRPHWVNEDLDYLNKRFAEEVLELAAAIDSENPNHIVLEAADVANMAMMIAEKAFNMYHAIDPREIQDQPT